MPLADRFQAPALCTLSIVVGITIGWWLRDNQYDSDISPSYRSQSEHSNDHTIAINTIEPIGSVSKSSAERIRSEFIQALDSEQFPDALLIFQRYEQLHSDTLARLSTELINYAHRYRTSNNLVPAIQLLELFTEHDYQNIELQRELAACYVATNQFIKALDIYTSARSYSHTREDIQSFDQQIHQIAQMLYEKNKEASSLKDLIPVFLRLSYLEPDYSLYRLALAEGYLLSDDTERATQELLVLQMDNEFNELASRYLTRISSEPSPESTDNEKSTVPLSATGEHYVVDTLPGNKHHARLLIDTGSSLTTLPDSILSELHRQNQASMIGSIDLTTAIGTHRSPLYRLKRFQIGDFLINNLEAAAFDPVDPNIDGLLGMNVLNHFHFFIDQNRQQLSLTPRHME